MVRNEVTVTQKDIREFARILRGIDNDVQDLKESRGSGTTIVLFRSTADTAIASDTVVAATEITNPTMIWDDADRGWAQSEWAD